MSPSMRRVVWCGLALAGLIVLAGVRSTIATASTSGTCTASIGGVDTGGRSSTNAADAIKLNWAQPVPVTWSSTDAITAYQVKLEYAGVDWTVAQGTNAGPSFSQTVNVPSYAIYGVGLYRVVGNFQGPGACSGAVLLNVIGKDPLSTVAGKAGAGLVGAGALGLAVSWLTSIFSGGRAAAAGRGLNMIALLLVPLVMAMPAGSPGWPDRTALIGAPPRRVRWRPRISLLGMLSGAMAGVGALVLLQQYGLLYPSREAAIAALGAGVFLSLVLTNLGRGRAVSRLNRRLARSAESTPKPTSTFSAPAGPPRAWRPSHSVGNSGVQAWDSPNTSGEQMARLDPGLAVEVVDRTGNWARILCSNGWSAWVDFRELVEGPE